MMLLKWGLMGVICPVLVAGEVARMDVVAQRGFKLDIDTETIERELHTSEEYQGFWESEE